ncbi:hypothetical protein O0I10_000539 [Lichtheimia ornata]|uniref:M-phase phosphoprotein 6 n=1 Tax=Lichtheimia ornata TaxID=688661 RepID=A0AAD8DI57_9FUNG|nr:uncharacterized protein O0I10_000539 [Lichtheimia ornata]KAJ8663300.1 hypothetical protein O0I10_000539 [Lichtheimia ornata]
MADKRVKQPSNRLLGMKFMQRSLEKEKQEELERERKRIITEAEWVLEYETDQVQKPKIRVDYQPSYLAFNDTRPNLGRQSFKEFNKVVEQTEQDAAEQKEKEKQDQRDRKAQQQEDEYMDTMKQDLRERRKGGKKRRAADDNKGKKKAKSDKAPQGFIKPQ